MDRIDDHGPSDTAEHKNRRDGRLSAAEINKHSPSLCRQYDAGFLGWQQSRCFHHQSRTVGLTVPIQSLRNEPTRGSWCARIHVATAVEVIVDLGSAADHPPIEEHCECCCLEITFPKRAALV